MFKISLSLALFVILSNSLIIAMGKTLSDFENEIGAIYPEEFKNYISQFKGCDLVSFKIMHDSFQLVTEDNVDIFNDQVFTPIELVNDLNAYIRKELQNPSLIALPIARSLTGDKYGFLFLLSGGFGAPMELFHRDTDRLYFKTVPIGSFFNYVKSSTQFNPVVMEITQEANSLTNSEEGTVIDYMQLYSSELSEERTKIPKGPFTVEISFHFEDDFTLVSISHFIEQKAKVYCYKTTFKDTEVKYHQYSYEHGAYWNYFSLLQYCMLQSIVEFQRNIEFSKVNFVDYWKHISLSELVRLGLNKP